MNLTQLVRNPQAQTQAILNRIERYVGFETPTGNHAALGALAAVIRQDFEALGARARMEQHSTGDHLILDLLGTGSRATAQPILVLAHHDTVWPLGQLSIMPLAITGDTLHGPGTYDMKAGIAILRESIELLDEHQLDRNPIRLIVVADEEIGSPTARALIEGQVGEVSCAIGLEPPHTHGELKTSRWGSTRVRITVLGKEAHAALAPEAGVSAIEEIVDQILAVRTVVGAHPSVLCNFGTITGGGRTNVVPGTASVDIGLRFRDATTEKAVLAQLAACRPVREGANIEVQILSNRPAWGADSTGAQFLAAVQEAAREVGQEISGLPAAGAADTNITGWCGIPSLDGLGALGRGAHAMDEQIHIPSLAPRAQLLAAIIHRL